MRSFFEAIGVTESTSSTETLAKTAFGLLAGSTIMLLTLIWPGVVAFGSYDLSLPSADNSSDEENVKPFSFTGFSLLSLPLCLINRQYNLFILGFIIFNYVG